MHIVTGGAGFIGSAFVSRLNAEGIDDIIVVDEKNNPARHTNLAGKRTLGFFDKHDFISLIESGDIARRCPGKIESIVHMGACSSTLERNEKYLLENNSGYTMRLASFALREGIRFVYASSGATYGAGEMGFSDSDSTTPHLKQINLYGESKQRFDLWALTNGHTKHMAGLKFFNVFGPNEYHKGEMRSVVHKAYEQVLRTGEVTLFKSHRSDYSDGEQKRDFIYIKDCLEVLWWLTQSPEVNGIFNLGTGIARSWNDLAAAVFSALNRPTNIRYIDMPESLRGQYQYFTQAPMDKLRSAGGTWPNTPLEEAVADYVGTYLQTDHQYI